MSHADAIKKHHDVLQRCTTINFYVVDYLRAEDVLDEEQEHDIKTERNHLKQRILLFQWLKAVQSDKYESFLKVMKDTEQAHVANLLTGSTEAEDHLPLSDARYRRLVKIRHKMSNVTRIDNEVIAELRSRQAISRIDAEEIRAEKVDSTKVSKLISVIMRRSNHSYNSFQQVLRKTLQTPAADFLSEGEMPAVHVSSNRPSLDGPLSLAFNDLIRNRTTDDADINKLLAEMNGLGLNPVKAKPGQSIVIFIYCKTSDDAMMFSQLFNSGRLHYIIECILNLLLLAMEPHNTKALVSWISLENDDIVSLEEFTGIEGCVRESHNRPSPLDQLYGRDATTQTDEEFSEWPQIKPAEGRPDEQDLCSSAYADENRERKLRDIIENMYELFPSAQADEVMEHIYENIGGDLFLALENLKVEGEILDGSKEKQQPRYIRALENYYAEQKQRQQKPTFQLPSDPKEEKIKPYYVHQFETIKQTQLEPIGFTQTRQYKSSPQLIKVFRTNAGTEGKWIRGMTILGKELFLLHGDSSAIEVYDSDEFGLVRTMTIAHKDSAILFHITSCYQNKCMYIISENQQHTVKAILKVNPSGKLMKEWSTGGDIGRLSVAYDANVILVVLERNKLNEYTPEGLFIRKLQLSADAGLVHPWHAIKLCSDRFLVSHGSRFHKDTLHRVCVVDDEGDILLSFGGKKGCQRMDCPMQLIVDGNGYIIVNDAKNARVLLLNPNLDYVQELVSKETGRLRNSRSICLDESSGRLFVADNEANLEKNLLRDGRILVFAAK